MTKKVFNHQAKFLREAREKANAGKGYSQTEVAELIGYKNGQFVSNVERDIYLCSIDVLRNMVNTYAFYNRVALTGL